LATTQVLTTKLYPPPPRPYLVIRPRLVERLNIGLQAGRQLILISAAAGFGKTTLASEWIAEGHLNGAIAWISLDKQDNNPTRFLFYLIAALQKVNPAFGENILPVLQSSQLPQLTEFVEELLNQIANSDSKVFLFLDDYHLVTSDAVHQVVQQAIERQPGNMRMIILTREDPPLPIPRMRVCGQVVEVRERDLRFTLPEAQEFLVEAMGLDLSSDEVGKLKERTEGWVAGMQLAALALEDYLDDAERRAFIDAFTGSDRFIVDYLVSEVLNGQTGPVREFLLHTSILERFCSDLCDQVVYGKPGEGRSLAILDSLEQGNMFLVPLDNQRQWYRYHHLFSEMLYNTLRRSIPELVSELHQRASEWFEARQLTPEAVKHALETGDWDFAAEMLDRHAMRLLIQSQGSLLIEWCNALPEDIIKRKPELFVYFAWALMLTFRNDYLQAVEEKLLQAERAIEAPDLPTHAEVGLGGALVPLRDWVAGQVCVLRSQLLLARFHTFVDPQELIALSHKGLELLPEIEKPIRSTCIINVALAHLIQNNSAEAGKALEEAHTATFEAGNFLGTVTVLVYQSRLAFYHGDLARAQEICRQWKARFATMLEQPEKDLPVVRGLDIIEAWILLERDQLVEAERLLDGALDVLGWASWIELLGFVAQARVRHLRGDPTGLQGTLARMEKMGPQHAICAEALRVLFQINRSPESAETRSRAETYVRKHEPDPNMPILALGIGPYHCDTEYLCNYAWARAQIALGHPQAALVFIEAALAVAQESNLIFRAIELLIAQALALNTLGVHPGAIKAMERAMDIAEPHGYLSVFNEGVATEQLLATVASRGEHSRYAKLLLTSFRKRSNEGPGPPDPLLASQPATIQPKLSQTTLVEPLSARELEVLSLIAKGFNNAEIAAHLYITQGTVKRHITNIYGKLNVQSRTQAILRGREIHLLP
jgi:LuxR family maltose regulon positive regulatory protein